MLDLYDFFVELQNTRYCIVKWNEKLTYETGADIDLFCYDVKDVVKHILYAGKKYVEKDKYEIEITEVIRDKHVHLDFKLKNKIDFRFDLYGCLPDYKRLNIREGFFSSIIDCSYEKKIKVGKNVINLYLPSKIDDMMIRYFEYIEWYDIRPEKVKHLEYIEKNLSEDEEKAFFDKIHYFTRIPEVQIKRIKTYTRIINDMEMGEYKAYYCS